MSKQKSGVDAAELRRRAESMAQWLIAHPLQGEADVQKLLHELQVYQVELEMQNAELRHAHDEAAVRTTSITLAKMRDEMSIPLKVIAEMSGQIRRSGVDAGQAKCLDQLDTASEQLSGIINAALALARSAPG